MKLTSISDVITNSSTEIFTLQTDKNLESVYEWLEENVKWPWKNPPEGYPFTKPEIMMPDSGVLKKLIDFGYLYDSKNPFDVKKYKLKHCLNYAVSLYDEDCDFKIKRFGITVRHNWIKFCEDNMEELLTYFPSDGFTEETFWEKFDIEEEYFNTYLFPGSRWTNTYDDFLEKFINWYEQEHPKYIPEWWSIPKHLDAQEYIGKLGFSGIEDNSIIWDDFEKINNEFNGRNWHMG